MSYDDWKTTNPADESLGTEPEEELHCSGCVTAQRQIADLRRALQTAADEITSLREVLDDAQSGYIPGSGYDLEWSKRRDKILGREASCAASHG